MKRIFVCSNLRADATHCQEDHEALARRYAKFIVDGEYGAPFVPHLLYPQFLDDGVLSERHAGINAGLAFMEVCDEVMVFMKGDLSLSEGMRMEMEQAKVWGIPVRTFVYSTRDEIEEVTDVLYT